MTVTIRQGDCREILRTMADESVNCCVTSPPYFGLRDYGVSGQIGLEASPVAFVDELVAVFREVKRVLREDGTLWLNLGDSYVSNGRYDAAYEAKAARGGIHSNDAEKYAKYDPRPAARAAGLKTKDLIGVPWMVAFALRADGWYLRQDIIWAKPNPMPESVTDRCTKSHEYIFLMSKSAKYHYDADAVAEVVTQSTVDRLSQPNLEGQAGSARIPGKTNGNMKAVGRGGKNAFRGQGYQRDTESGPANRNGRDMRDIGVGETRNRRSVWSVATQPFREAHFATFPPALIEPCILAGCPVGGIVLDPFGGAGTTGLVADRLRRGAVLIELNPEYAAIADRRIRGDAGMFADMGEA